MEANLDCDKTCFGHYNLREDVNNIFDKAKEQLEFWMDTVRRYVDKNKNVEAEEIFSDLVNSDRCIQAFAKLEKDIQKREKYFALNSINGMLGYLANT